MKAFKVIGIIVATIFVVAILFFTVTPAGRTIWNNFTHSLKKADEVRYEVRKQVEDTARAYIASYNTDRAIYEAYYNSDDANKREYAEAAKMRAIATANSYNEYLRQNSYVWKNNMPADLPMTLPTEMAIPD